MTNRTRTAESLVYLATIATLLGGGRRARADAPSNASSESVDPERGTSRPPPLGRRVLRVLGEEALVIGAGVSWYWVNRDLNSLDWDYRRFVDRYRGGALRFDANDFTTNWVYHPFAGFAFHTVARANGFSLGGAYATSVAASLSWETFVEFHEKFSINDMIATSTPGVPIGEHFHHLGNYLFHVHGARSRGVGHRLLAWTVGFPTTMHRRLDGMHSDDSLASAFETRFRLAYGLESYSFGGSDTSLVQTFSVESNVADRTRSGAAGPRFRFFHDGDVSSFRLRLEFLDDRPGVDLFSEVVVFGGRRVLGDGVSAVRRETTIGSEVAFVFTRREWDAYTDHYGVVELFGPSVDHRVTRGVVDFRLGARLAPTFSAVSAPGYQAWVENHGDALGKSSLADFGYHNALGGTLRLESELRVGPLSLGGRLALAYADSVEGLDRHQAALEVDQRCEERRATWDAHVRFRPFRARGLRVGLEARGVRSRSTIESVESERRLVALGASIAHER